MPTAFDFCLPTAAKIVPDGPAWLHEIKDDGYRLRVERQGRDVRLLTRNGHNWTSRYPWIVEAALKNREQQFVIDGEAVVLGVDGGASDFNALHSRKHDAEVQLYAFDVLALGGEDLRPLPLTMRKANLAQLLSGRTGCSSPRSRPARSGRSCFRAACSMGLGTARPTLWRRPVERLDQGEEPDASGDDAGILAHAKSGLPCPP